MTQFLTRVKNYVKFTAMEASVSDPLFSALWDSEGSFDGSLLVVCVAN